MKGRQLDDGQFCRFFACAQSRCGFRPYSCTVQNKDRASSGSASSMSTVCLSSFHPTQRKFVSRRNLAAGRFLSRRRWRLDHLTGSYTFTVVAGTVIKWHGTEYSVCSEAHRFCCHQSRRHAQTNWILHLGPPLQRIDHQWKEGKEPLEDAGGAPGCCCSCSSCRGVTVYFPGQGSRGAAPTLIGRLVVAPGLSAQHLDANCLQRKPSTKLFGNRSPFHGHEHEIAKTPHVFSLSTPGFFFYCRFFMHALAWVWPGSFYALVSRWKFVVLMFYMIQSP